MRTTMSGALALLVCATLLGACGDDATTPGPASGTASSSPSPSSSPGASEPEPTEPSVQPATGAQVELGSLTLNLPAGFEPREASSMGGDLVTASGPDGAARIAFVAAEDFNRQSLDKAVEFAITTGFWTRKPKRLPDVEVDGVTMYHLSGPSGAGFTDVQFGTEHGGYDTSLTISASGSAAERQHLIDSILATASWQ